jgi:hypothetical protein
MGKKSKSKKNKMAERARKRAAERESHRSGGSGTLNLPGGVEYFKPEKKGKYRLDLLPYRVTKKGHPEVEKGELWYQRTIFVHFGVGADDKAFLCPKTINKACPICEEWKKLRKSEDADEDMVKALRPKERELFNVIHLDEDEEKVLLFEYSYHNFGRLLEEELEGDGGDEVAGFAELEGGKTLVVKFRKKTIGKNSFFEASDISFEDRDDYDEAILEDVLDLDKILNIPSYEELQKAFLEIEDDDEDKDEEEKSSKKKSKKKKEDDDEDDDDEDEDSDLDEDDDDDSDSEDEDDDDEDEDSDSDEDDDDDFDSDSEDEDEGEDDDSDDEEEKSSKKKKKKSKKKK